MSTLPRASLAGIDLRKLTDYCLSPTHPRGRHKARTFRAALGMGQADAEQLRDGILALLPSVPAVLEAADQFGSRYRVDLDVTVRGRVARVRTIWLAAPDESPPRLITCYVL